MTGIKSQEKEGTECLMHIDGNVQKSCYMLQDEVAVSLQHKCILHICGQRSQQTVAVGLSDYSLAVYDIYNLKHVLSFAAHTSTITDIRFGVKNEQLLYSSSLDGTVKIHDLRCKTYVSEFRDDSEGPTMLKPLTSFDFSCDENFGSAGTELVDGDAFVLFWDIRSLRLLGGYWESHTDDITQVRFHPEEKNTLATGSVDGLVNVFDISKECEDDALTYCLNTESSIDKLHWFHRRNNTFDLACITHTEQLQLWEVEGASPYTYFSREAIANILKDDTVDNTYLVNAHNQVDGSLLIIAGYSSEKRAVLQALSLDKHDMTAVRSASCLKENRQTVRSSWHNAEDEVLLTGGEGGFLSLWKPCNDEAVDTVGSQLKDFKIRHKSKTKPYQRK